MSRELYFLGKYQMLSSRDAVMQNKFKSLKLTEYIFSVSKNITGNSWILLYGFIYLFI